MVHIRIFSEGSRVGINDGAYIPLPMETMLCIIFVQKKSYSTNIGNLNGQRNLIKTLYSRSHYFQHNNHTLYLLRQTTIMHLIESQLIQADLRLNNLSTV